jgi:PncC family amidohydrolase
MFSIIKVIQDRNQLKIQMMKKLLILSCICLMTFDSHGYDQDMAKQLVKIATDKKLTIATAESCTGGMISGAITAIPGSSSVFEYGFVTYANEAKEKLLGVKHQTIKDYGAVSEETVREMASGALKASEADIAVAVTGIAGPSGGSLEKPVGLVYIAVATQDRVEVNKNIFIGDRHEIRMATTQKAIELLIEILKMQ